VILIPYDKVMRVSLNLIHLIFLKNFELTLIVLLVLAVNRSCSSMIQNEMFNLLFIHFQVLLIHILGLTYNLITKGFH